MSFKSRSRDLRAARECITAEINSASGADSECAVKFKKVLFCLIPFSLILKYRYAAQPVLLPCIGPFKSPESAVFILASVTGSCAGSLLTAAYCRNFLIIYHTMSDYSVQQCPVILRKPGRSNICHIKDLFQQKMARQQKALSQSF